MPRKPIKISSGKICASCGEYYKEPVFKNKNYVYSDDDWDYESHENPKDCIVYLKKELDKCKEDIQWLIYQVKKNENI